MIFVQSLLVAAVSFAFLSTAIWIWLSQSIDTSQPDDRWLSGLDDLVLVVVAPILAFVPAVIVAVTWAIVQAARNPPRRE